MRRFFSSRLGAPYIATVVGVVVISSLAAWYGIFDSWQAKLTDRFYVSHQPASDVVIVAVDDASLQAIGQWPWKRATIGRLVQKLDGADTIAIDINIAEPSRYGSSDDRQLARALRLSTARIVLPVRIQNDKIVTRPAEQFAGIGERGFINTLVDADGVIRRAYLAHGTHRSFGAAVQGRKVGSLATTTRLGYVGPTGSFPTFSVVDVLNGRVPERVFEGATVLIGATAPDLQDFVHTPMGEMAGVEYHANVVDFLGRSDRFIEVGIVGTAGLIIVIAAAAAWCVARGRRVISILTSLAAIVVLFMIGVFTAFSFDVVVPSLYPLVACAITAGVTTTVKYVSESRQKQFIRETFQHYLAPEALDELLNDPSKLRLGGETREVTLLFSDIRGFTSIAEALSAQELTDLLNRYLGEMTDTIMAHRGVVDKYVGDAIMAFWGAPISLFDHATRACRAVQVMATRLNVLNDRLREQGRPELHIGVGLNTGEAVIGNMGSQQRFDYTALGDEVNFASRLEGLTKQYGVMCLVSETTYQQGEADSKLQFRRLDRVAVKGKAEPRRIYELMVERHTSELAEILAAFDTGLQHYEAGEWDEAIASFDTVLARRMDGPAQLLRERCRLLRKDPPVQWDGVYIFTEK